MATYNIGAGNYIRPYRNVRVRTAPEGASQTFKVGAVLIRDTTGGSEHRVVEGTNTPTTGTVVGIAACAASGVTGNPVTFWPLDEQSEFIIVLKDTQSAANSDVNGQSEYGVFTDSSKGIWRLDNTNTTQKVFRVIGYGPTPDQSGAMCVAADVNAAYIVRPASQVQAIYKS